MTTYKIYLYDPAGGGMSEPTPGTLLVQHSLLGEVAEIEPLLDILKKPGELRVTREALDVLDVEGVKDIFLAHIAGLWSNAEEEDKKANDEALENGGVIYNLDRKRGVYLITYQGDNSTLITREQY